MSRPTVLALLAGAFLTLTTSSSASPAVATHRTGTIAFIRLVNGPVFGGRLLLVGPDGTGLRQVTPPGTVVYEYAWSPDGKLIAYIDQRLSLWLVRPDGKGRRLLLPTSRLSSIGLSWSPDGKEIAILSAGSNLNPRTASCPTNALYVVPINGGHPVRLGTKTGGCAVAWSPRGDQIADDGKGIGVMRADGTGPRHFLHDGGSPQWSADGTQLVFGISRYSTFAVVDADGKGFHVVTTHAYIEYPVAWSPQGRRILYGRADHKGIYVIDSDGRNNHRVTRDSPPEAEWRALAWSPTGGSIVYDTGEGNNTDLYVIGTDGRDKVQLTNTPAIDINPSWVAR